MELSNWKRQLVGGTSLSIFIFKFAVWITQINYDVQLQKDVLSTLTKKEYLTGKTESFDFIISKYFYTKVYTVTQFHCIAK